MGKACNADWYDEIYRTSAVYDGPAKTLYWDPLWRDAARWLQGRSERKVVDLGCGPGHLAQVLEETDGLGAVEYNGFDFSKVAVQKAVDLKLPERFKFHVWDLEKERFPLVPDAVYIACEFLEHVTEDLQILSGIPKGAPVYFTLPKKNSVGHVRHFPTSKLVEERYLPYVSDLTVYPIEASWFAGHGYKKG